MFRFSRRKPQNRSTELEAVNTNVTTVPHAGASTAQAEDSSAPSENTVTGNNSLARSDFICVSIGRPDVWKLGHTKFDYGEAQHSPTDENLFMALRRQLYSEQKAQGFFRFVFPIKLSRVEYHEVRDHVLVSPVYDVLGELISISSIYSTTFPRLLSSERKESCHTMKTLL